MTPNTKAVAASPATDTVVEYVLHKRVDGELLPVMSDRDLDVVRQSRVNTIADAVRTGQARPDLVITQRTCTYPLKNGKRQAEGSTCEEQEL